VLELDEARRAGELLVAVLCDGLPFDAVMDLFRKPLLSARFEMRKLTVSLGDVFRHQVDELRVLGAVVDSQRVARHCPEVAQPADEVSGQT